MSGHIADLVHRDDLRDAAEERIRQVAIQNDFHGDFNPSAYYPPGPVAQAFLNDTALTSVLMGPLGGGKTTTCTFKRILCGTRAPIAWHPEDGKPTRMCRGIVLRDTFRSVEKTVLESWRQWFPKGYPGSNWAGGNDRPVTHTLRFMGMDGIRLEMITEFAGLNDSSIETMMKGREYSFGWPNELDTHAEGALDDIEQRVGRYPSANILLTRREIAELEQTMQRKLYAPTERMRMVIGDMNAPTIDNWTYKTLVTERKPDRSFWQQPSGLSDEAENIFNLEVGYYDRIVNNQEEHFIRRMVHNQFGYSRAGKAVHPSFDHRRHVADRPIAFKPDLDLYIGVDASTAGLSPAAMFGQVPGRIALINELFVDTGCGPGRFGEALQQKMQEDYPNVPRNRVKLFFDPAAQGGADTEAGQLNAMDTIASFLRVPARIPGSGSNELSLRLGAIDAELRGYIEPNTSLLISPTCPLYIAGIAGQYRFKKKPNSAANDYEDLPEKKHPVSDIQDAGQYLVLGVRGARVQLGITSGRQSAGNGGWASQANGATGWRSQGGFDPHKAGVR
jgi:hypothetical protein